MAVFEEVTLTWEGREYTIAPDRLMQAIARIEDTLTLAELHDYAQRGTAPLGKLAIAYASALRHAGAPVTSDQVYAGMFRQDGAGVSVEAAAMAAINGLLAMMLPPGVAGSAPPEGAAGKLDAGARASGSSKRPTRPR